VLHPLVFQFPHHFQSTTIVFYSAIAFCSQNNPITKSTSYSTQFLVEPQPSAILYPPSFFSCLSRRSSHGCLARNVRQRHRGPRARVADEVHPDLPEGDHIFTKHVKLFPAGCLVLVEGDAVCGYAISHPIRDRQPPALDSLLGAIAPDANQYYIYDVAIMPRLRGRGLAAECIHRLLALANRYPTTSLVSVYGTAPFWGRFGFVPEPVDAVLAEKLRNYGDDATYLSRRNSPDESGA
jgi:GNAT superfamily N-acetyltransferase